jgi:hypothetical protein
MAVPAREFRRRLFSTRHLTRWIARPEFGAARARRGLVCEIGAWQHGEVLALYTHGVFENAAVLQALFRQHAPTLDDTLDGLADFIDEHIGARTLTALLG